MPPGRLAPPRRPAGAVQAPPAIPCPVPVDAQVTVQGPPGVVWVAPVPPGGNGAPQVSYNVRVTVTSAAGAAIACLTRTSGTWDTRAGTWAAAGPVTVYAVPYVLNACQEHPHPGCRWMVRGVSDWEVVGPDLVPPRSPVTVEVATTGGTIVKVFPIVIRVGHPPAGA